MKRLGTEINGKSAPIIKVSKDKNKEAKVRICPLYAEIFVHYFLKISLILFI